MGGAQLFSATTVHRVQPTVSWDLNCSWAASANIPGGTTMIYFMADNTKKYCEDQQFNLDANEKKN